MKLNQNAERSIVNYVNWVFANPGIKWPGDETIKRVWRLREGVEIEIDLPADITAFEMTRWCSFMASLPFHNHDKVKLFGGGL